MPVRWRLQKRTVIYSGEPIKPEVVVKNGDTVLVEGTDYKVVYENAVNAAKKEGENPPTIIVHGMGNYAGTKTLPFTIEKAQNTPNMPQITMVLNSSYTKIGNLKLPEGWCWQDSYKEVILMRGNCITAVAQYCGAGISNYENTTVSITITVNKLEDYKLLKLGKSLKDKKGKAIYKVILLKEDKVEVKYVKPVNKKSKTVTIPDTVTLSDGTVAEVTNISAKAFKGNTQMTKVILGKNVKSIGKEAFRGCKNLKSITIKSKKLTYKNVGNKAFSAIPNTAKIKVPKSRLAAYKKLLNRKGLSKKAKITK